MQTKFKIGDIINSSLSSAQKIIDIRIGVPSDFKTHILANGMKFRVEWENELCYVLEYPIKNKPTTVCGVEAIDSDHHLKGTEMFRHYQDNWNEFYKDVEGFIPN